MHEKIHLSLLGDDWEYVNAHMILLSVQQSATYVKLA